MPVETTERKPLPGEQAAPEPPPSPTITPARLSSATVWRSLERASFAVLSYVSPKGEPRSSGVIYASVGHRIYVVVAANSWKARQLVTGQRVSLTVPIRRGGLLTLMAPIPPATISFQARATVHPPGSLDMADISPKVARLLPDHARAISCVLELQPEGRFLTYGIGTSLMGMRDPEVARARVPVV